jgi:hypothetical protein
VAESHGGPDHVEWSEVTIPAWTARTELPDLITAPGTGFAEIAQVLVEQLPADPRGDRVIATQAARARFDTNGFSAAGVTVVLDRVGAAAGPPPHRTIERKVEVRFDRPFAVAAVTNTHEFRRAGTVLQRGLPAFGALVTEPEEPSEPNVSRRWF